MTWRGGGYLGIIGETFLNNPRGFVHWGDDLIVAELYSRLAVLDADDGLIGVSSSTARS